MHQRRRAPYKKVIEFGLKETGRRTSYTGLGLSKAAKESARGQKPFRTTIVIGSAYDSHAADFTE